MAKQNDQIFRTVEYSRDKRIMNKVPLALLLGLAGLFFVLHVDTRPPDFQTVLLFLFHAVDDLTTSQAWARRPGLPMNVFGRVLVICSLGWVVFAFYRHLRPARPILTFSPAGISAASWRDASGSRCSGRKVR